MTTDRKQLEADCLALHACYVQMTQNPISYIGCHYVWCDWVRRGLTLKDLKLWLNDLRYRIGKGELDYRSLRFTNAIANIQRCEEGVVELRRMMRGRGPDTDRESVLRSANRPETSNSLPAKSIQDIVHKVTADPEAAARAFRELQRLKAQL